MKKLNKRLALCLALTMLLLCVPFTASAVESEYGPEDLRSIHGIDYNRITQKATGDSKSYPVELKMGDLTFNGELTGSHGLSYEELNKIINDVLKEKKLTVEQIQLVKALSENVGEKATEFWGAQVLEGLLSYLPLPEGLPKWTEYVGGVSDVFAIMVDGKLPTAGEYAEGRAKDLVAKAAEKAIETGFEKSKEYIKKVPWAAAKRIPLLGQMINTVKVGIEWQSNDKFDAYLKALEQKMADVNDFYSECSRRANKLAEEKGEGSYSIKFNNAVATDHFTFWGISGLMSEWTLSGELVKGISGAGEGVTGNYEGTLTLSMKALDMAETFDRNWVQNTTEWPSIMRVLKSGDKLTDTPQQTTKLERTISGDFNLYIPGESSGIYEPAVFGSFNGADTIDFSFSRKAESSYSGYTDGSNTLIYGANLTSSNVNTVYFEGYHTFPTIMGSAGTGPDTWAQSTGDLDMNIGTVWDPLDGEVSMEINFGR